LRGIRRERLRLERVQEMRASAAAARGRSEVERKPGNVVMEGDNLDNTVAIVIDEAADSDTYVVGY
jgi:hypothetical protein